MIASMLRIRFVILGLVENPLLLIQLTIHIFYFLPQHSKTVSDRMTICCNDFCTCPEEYLVQFCVDGFSYRKSIFDTVNGILQILNIDDVFCTHSVWRLEQAMFSLFQLPRI